MVRDKIKNGVAAFVAGDKRKSESNLNETILKAASKLGRDPGPYTNFNKTLTIISETGMGSFITLSDGSHWQFNKASSLRHTYRPNEKVKVFAPDEKNPDSCTIELQDGQKDSALWYFRGYPDGKILSEDEKD